MDFRSPAPGRQGRIPLHSAPLCAHARCLVAAAGGIAQALDAIADDPT